MASRRKLTWWVPGYLRGGAGNDQIWGGLGNDALVGGLDTDYMYGESGNDELTGADDLSVDYLDGGPGSDTCYANTYDSIVNCETVIYG